MSEVVPLFYTCPRATYICLFLLISVSLSKFVPVCARARHCKCVYNGAIFIATNILLYSSSTSWSSLIMAETPEGCKMKRSRDVGDAGRCSKQSSKRSYGPKKKRFAGNRYTKAKKMELPRRNSCRNLKN